MGLRKTLDSRFILASLFLVLIAFEGHSQGSTYSLSTLTQEPISVTSRPTPSGSQEVGDTSFTLFSGASVDFKTYFVNGSQYDNIFNPNPTGIIINNRYFYFFCGIEMSIRQNFSNILDMAEFSFLGKNYLMLINFREDCLGEGCRYRCYNLFDITNPSRPKQMAFSSIFEGTDSFGEFNNDGILDLIRVAPKPPEDYTGDKPTDHFLFTAYTVNNGTLSQLNNSKGHAYFIYGKGNDDVSSFSVLQADWFFPLKDETGSEAPATSYFAEYISFDPLYRYLYNPDGVRIEKNRWSVHLIDLADLEAAQEYCRRMQEQEFEDVYIVIDQYGGNINYQVFAGNFVSKTMAMQYQNKLRLIGYSGKIADLRNDY